MGKYAESAYHYKLGPESRLSPLVAEMERLYGSLESIVDMEDCLYTIVLQYVIDVFAMLICERYPILLLIIMSGFWPVAAFRWPMMSC